MSHIEITRLAESVESLRAAIISARTRLASHPDVPAHFLSRLDSYEDIYQTQREIVVDIEFSLTLGKLDEVVQGIKRLNALSSLIRQDAEEIVQTLRGEIVAPEIDYFM